MTITRRTVMRSLGASVLGASVLGTGVLTGCRRGRGAKKTTPPPTAQSRKIPQEQLVLASIGAGYGIANRFERQIAAAISEAVVDVNAAYQGVFGKPLKMLERHLMKDPGEELGNLISTLQKEKVSAVITSIDDDALIKSIPRFVEAGIAVIDLQTAAMAVRDPTVQHGGMLLRLAPNTKALAITLHEEAFSGGSDKAGPPGTVAFLAEDTTVAHSLHDELASLLAPSGGKVVAAHFYPLGKMGDRAAIVQKIVKAKPALLVADIPGTDAGPFLGDLYRAMLGPDGKPVQEMTKRLGPAGTIDYRDAELPVKCLEKTQGWVPGGVLSDEHINMMLNADRNLVNLGYAYSQQAYDAVIMLCTAAYAALSVKGAEIAAKVPPILADGTECNDYGSCRQVMEDALASGEQAPVHYVGRMGAVQLGTDGDPISGSLRTYSWSEQNVLEAPQDKGFERPV